MWGGVATISGVRHPIAVARLLLYDTPVLLVGPGARAFAMEHGVEPLKTEELARPERSRSQKHKSDTVGCVALDTSGTIVAATSTGGISGKRPGRTGDSAIAGAGFYADNALGGVSMSGDGESIARVVLASHVMRGLESGSPQAAIDLALKQLQRVGGEAG